MATCFYQQHGHVAYPSCSGVSIISSALCNYFTSDFPIADFLDDTDTITVLFPAPIIMEAKVQVNRLIIISGQVGTQEVIDHCSLEVEYVAVHVRNLPAMLPLPSVSWCRCAPMNREPKTLGSQGTPTSSSALLFLCTIERALRVLNVIKVLAESKWDFSTEILVGMHEQGRCAFHTLLTFSLSDTL